MADKSWVDISGALIPAVAVIAVAYFQLRRQAIKAKRVSVFHDRMFREFVASLLPLMRTLQETTRARAKETQDEYDQRLLVALDSFLSTTDNMLVGPKEE